MQDYVLWTMKVNIIHSRDGGGGAGMEGEREVEVEGLWEITHPWGSLCQMPLSLALIICSENMVHNMDTSRL